MYGIWCVGLNSQGHVRKLLKSKMCFVINYRDYLFKRCFSSISHFFTVLDMLGIFMQTMKENAKIVNPPGGGAAAHLSHPDADPLPQQADPPPSEGRPLPPKADPLSYDQCCMLGVTPYEQTDISKILPFRNLQCS